MVSSPMNRKSNFAMLKPLDVNRLSSPDCTRVSSPKSPMSIASFMKPTVLPESEPTTASRVAGAFHVLATEAKSLLALSHLYAAHPEAQTGFTQAIEVITQQQNGGKIVLCGVGKSGHVAKKLVATFNSLGMQTVYLHPTEALHGDLGVVGRNDTVIFITYSGKTPELLQLLPHLEDSVRVVVLTGATQPKDCELIRHRPDAILLPAPTYELEKTSFGVNAPTTSVTMAIAVGHALAIVASREMYRSVPAVFAKNHPGGAIGAGFKPNP
ncbi:SIS domain-containing protein [Apiospora kogelbergensis]|uniref:SIS domain-containing protein n=1 Tax=Apiospora kogelbergensis TaxID=1337665 RepID=A0AAW0QU85_9PEZI